MEEIGTQCLPLPAGAEPYGRADRSEPAVDEPRPREVRQAAPRSSARPMIWRLATWMIVIDIVWAALLGGLWLRAWVWGYTASGACGLRSGDIQNGYHWGLIVYNNAAADENVDWRGRRSPTSWGRFFKAYLAVYDEIEQTAPDGRFGLDYAPGRLLSMALWVRHVRSTYPLVTAWQPQYAYSAPLLKFNTTCELIAAIGAFFLVRLWVARGRARARPAGGVSGSLPAGDASTLDREAVPRDRDPVPALCGLFAALLVWLNPATLVDAHVWPQWDVWVMPFYFWGLYLASSGRWFGAGAVVGVGIMFKGQILFAIPLLILWPLFAGRPIDALRVVIGFLTAVAVVTCGWLVNGANAWYWVAGVVSVAVIAIVFRYLPRQWRVAGGLLLALLIFWPWVRHDRPAALTLSAGLALAALIALIPHLPRKVVSIAFAAVLAGAFFSAGWMFHGSRGWFDLGFGYGTYKHLAMSNNSSNLPALLAFPPYKWNLPDVVFTLDVPRIRLHWPAPMRSLLGLSYFVALVLCSVGAAIKSRRNDPQILITFVAPWVLLFAIMPQMHQRYLMWGAVFSATMVGVSMGMTLLHLLLTLLAAGTIFNQLLGQDPTFAPALHRTLTGFYPSMGWLIALCAAIFLYRSIATGRKSRLLTPLPLAPADRSSLPMKHPDL